VTRPRCGNDPHAQLTDHTTTPLPSVDRAALRDRIAEALTAEHYRRAEARIVASPEEHCAGMADAVLAVLPAPADRAAVRYRTAWHSARRRASVLSAEITRRAPLLGEYAAQIANLRTMCEVSIARENDLIEERDQLREARADRAAVLREAIARVRKIPVQCIGLTGPVWFGQGWKDAIGEFEEIAERLADEDQRRLADETPARLTPAERAVERADALARFWETHDDLPYAQSLRAALAGPSALAAAEPAAGARQDGARP